MTLALYFQKEENERSISYDKNNKNCFDCLKKQRQEDVLHI